MPDQKINFCSKFAYKFSVLLLQMLTLEVLSLSIHYLMHTWTTCWPNLNQIVGSKMFRIFSFLTKTKFLKTIFDIDFMPFCKMFLQLKQLLNGTLLIFRLSSFSVPKIMVVRHVNQVKSASKHWRLDQYETLSQQP